LVAVLAVDLVVVLVVVLAAGWAGMSAVVSAAETVVGLGAG